MHGELLDSVRSSALIAASFEKLNPTLKALVALGVTFAAGMGVMAGIQTYRGLPGALEELDQRTVRQGAQITEIQNYQRAMDRRLETVICILEVQAESRESLDHAISRCRPLFPPIYP